MNEIKNTTDEISLIDLFAVVWKRKIMIIGITVFAMIASVGIAIASKVVPPEKSFMPNEYTSTALMLINDSSSSGGGLMQQLASGGLGSLAGLTGVSGGSSYGELCLYLAGADSLLDAIITEFNLVERYNITEHVKTASRKALKNNLRANLDAKSGVFSVSFTDIDPVFAQKVAAFTAHYYEKRLTDIGLDKNKLEKANLEKNLAQTLLDIKQLQTEAAHLQNMAVNNAYGRVPAIAAKAERLRRELSAQEEVYRQLKVQYELAKITLASERPIFQILEMPEVPDQKSGPSRGKLCIILTFAAFFFSVFLAFLLNAIENIRKDPDAIAKIKGN